jgi:nicotinate-nucleotide adenylyltransferase
MRIGLYGGTFDPPHNAHLKLAEWVRQKLRLDYIYFIPAAKHAFKKNSHLSPEDIRVKMVEAAVGENRHFRLSRIEMDRIGISYTVDTIRNFSQYENIPAAKLYYIMGIDNLAEFHRWKDPESIAKLVKVVVIRRSGPDNKGIISSYRKKVMFLASPILDISATEIREMVKNGLDISDLVPPAVNKIIHEYRLYQNLQSIDP